MARKKKKNTSAVATADGALDSFVNDTSYPQNNQPDNDSLWGACREALNADASRKAQADAKLRSAALRLGFAKNESGRWVKQCPGCETEVGLYTAPNGHVRASGYNPKCGAVPSLQQWLIDGGFQS
jgi:hypothetical protein